MIKFRKYNNYLFTNLVASVAVHHKIPFKIISKTRSIIRLKRRDGSFAIFKRYHNNLNNSKHKLISNNKFKCGKLLRKNKLPATKQIVITTHTKTRPPIFNDWNFPLVVKQINGTGGRNIWTNCQNWKSVTKTLKKARNRNLNKVLLEEQVNGDDYRVLIVNGKIIDCIRRRAPRVIGDGEKTVAQLIKIANVKKKYKMIPESRVLQKQGIKLRTIPSHGQVVRISGLCNYHQGGTLNRIPIENIHKENSDMFLKTVDILKLKVAGIDFISSDITKPFTENDARITEVNADANLDLHYTTHPKTMKFVEKAVLEMLH